MNEFMLLLGGIAAGFFGGLIGVPLLMALLRTIGFYTIVNEGTAHVYVLFGNVIGVLREPGFYVLPLQLGPAAFLTNWLGQRHVIDTRLDQRYLRSQPVNTEEGAPMGIGVWYEMRISDPVAYLFKNADPQGSLAANVSNAVVRSLSNQPLSDMLENRHTMSRAVRDEVSPTSREWGYELGSVYIRKVHFRDHEMIRRGQPPAPGDVGDQAGRCQSGEHHHQHCRAPGGDRVCPCAGDPATDRRRCAESDQCRRRRCRCTVRHPGISAAARGSGAADADAG